MSYTNFAVTTDATNWPGLGKHTGSAPAAGTTGGATLEPILLTGSLNLANGASTVYTFDRCVLRAQGGGDRLLYGTNLQTNARLRLIDSVLHIGGNGGTRVNQRLSELTRTKVIGDTSQAGQKFVYTQAGNVAVIDGAEFIGIYVHEMPGLPATYQNTTYTGCALNILNWEAGDMSLRGVSLGAGTSGYDAWLGNGNSANRFRFRDCTMAFTPTNIAINRASVAGDRLLFRYWSVTEQLLAGAAPIQDAVVIYRSDEATAGAQAEVARYTTDSAGRIPGGRHDTLVQYSVDSGTTRSSGLADPATIRNYTLTTVANFREIRSYAHLPVGNLAYNLTSKVGDLNTATYSNFYLTADPYVGAITKTAALALPVTHTASGMTVTGAVTLDELYASRKAYWRATDGVHLGTAAGTDWASTLAVVVQTGGSVSAGTLIRTLTTTATVTVQPGGSVAATYTDAAGKSIVMSGWPTGATAPDGMPMSQLGVLFEADASWSIPDRAVNIPVTVGTTGGVQVTINPAKRYLLVADAHGYYRSGYIRIDGATATAVNVSLERIDKADGSWQLDGTQSSAEVSAMTLDPSDYPTAIWLIFDSAVTTVSYASALSKAESVLTSHAAIIADWAQPLYDHAESTFWWETDTKLRLVDAASNTAAVTLLWVNRETANEDKYAMRARPWRSGYGLNMPEHVALIAAADLAAVAGQAASAVRANLATELSRLDVAVSSRLATSGYTAPTSAPSAASVAGAVRSELTAELARLDTPVSSRLAASAYGSVDLSPALTQLAAIRVKTDNLPADPAAASVLLEQLGYLQTDVGTLNVMSSQIAYRGDEIFAKVPTAAQTASAVRTNLAAELARLDTAVSTRLAASAYGSVDLSPALTELTAIRAKTENLPAVPASQSDVRAVSASLAALSIPTAAQTADAVRLNLAAELARLDVSVSTRLAASAYGSVNLTPVLDALGALTIPTAADIATAAWAHPQPADAAPGTMAYALLETHDRAVDPS